MDGEGMARAGCVVDWYISRSSVRIYLEPTLDPIAQNDIFDKKGGLVYVLQNSFSAIPCTQECMLVHTQCRYITPTYVRRIFQFVEESVLLRKIVVKVSNRIPVLGKNYLKLEQWNCGSDRVVNFCTYVYIMPCVPGIYHA